MLHYPTLQPAALVGMGNCGNAAGFFFFGEEVTQGKTKKKTNRKFLVGEKSDFTKKQKIHETPRKKSCGEFGKRKNGWNESVRVAILKENVALHSTQVFQSVLPI